jgi:hypothetical protein
MAVIRAARLARPRWWPGVLAWALWALAMLGLPVIAWLDHLSRRAGRPDLVQFGGSSLHLVVALVSAATVGAVLATRRPRHPVGWLLLVLGLALNASGVAAAYTAYGLVARPGALPAAGAVARYVLALILAALLALSFILLLTPTGSLPSPRWRWWAWATVAAPVALLVALAVARGSLDPRVQAENQLDFRGVGGALLVVSQVALGVTLLALMVAAGSLVLRFRRARGVERQQLRWVAWAAMLVALAAVAALASAALGLPEGTVALSDHPVWLPPLRRSNLAGHSHDRVVRVLLGGLPVRWASTSLGFAGVSRLNATVPWAVLRRPPRTRSRWRLATGSVVSARPA